MGQLFFASVFSLVLAGGPAFGSAGKKKLALSEEDVLKKSLSLSPFIQKAKIENKKRLSRLSEKRGSFYGGSLSSSWIQSQKNSPQVFIFDSVQDENKNLSLSLEKSAPYGLKLKSSYSDMSEKRELSNFLKSAQAPSQIYRKNLSLEISAGLTKAFAQHWALKAIRLGEEASRLMYMEKAEELALKSAGQYWKAYLAWTARKQTKEGLKTYEKLVRQINSKKKYSFLNPGERPQILAEYENLKQLADEKEQSYKNEEKALLLFLSENPEQTEIQFKIEPLKPPPAFKKNSVESSRLLRIKDAEIKERGLKLKSLRANLFPNIKISGRGGLIPGAKSPGSLSFSRRHSFYELEAGLSWSLFSPSVYQKAQQEKYSLEESKIEREILKRELKNSISSLASQIAVGWKNAQRAKKAYQWQKQAFKELSQSFRQGRADVFELISAESKLRESEMRKQKARSEYALSILQLLALRDNLAERYL